MNHHRCPDEEEEIMQSTRLHFRPRHHLRLRLPPLHLFLHHPRHHLRLHHRLRLPPTSKCDQQ